MFSKGSTGDAEKRASDEIDEDSLALTGLAISPTMFIPPSLPSPKTHHAASPSSSREDSERPSSHIPARVELETRPEATPVATVDRPQRQPGKREADAVQGAEEDQYWKSRYGFDSEDEELFDQEDDEDVERSGMLGGIWLNRAPGEASTDEPQRPTTNGSRQEPKSALSQETVIGFGTITAIPLAYDPEVEKAVGEDDPDEDEFEDEDDGERETPSQADAGTTLLDQERAQNNGVSKVFVPSSRFRSIGLSSMGILLTNISSWQTIDFYDGLSFLATRERTLESFLQSKRSVPLNSTVMARQDVFVHECLSDSSVISKFQGRDPDFVATTLPVLVKLLDLSSPLPTFTSSEWSIIAILLHFILGKSVDGVSSPPADLSSYPAYRFGNQCLQQVEKSKNTTDSHDQKPVLSSAEWAILQHTFIFGLETPIPKERAVANDSSPQSVSPDKKDAKQRKPESDARSPRSFLAPANSLSKEEALAKAEMDMLAAMKRQR
jgi:hypothetical protein